MPTPTEEFDQAITHLHNQLINLPAGKTTQTINQIAKNHNIAPAALRRMLNLPDLKTRVHQLLAIIPGNAVTTYGDIAEALNTSPQAVARVITAKKKNNPTWIPPEQAARVLNRPNMNGEYMLRDEDFASSSDLVNTRSEALKLTSIIWEDKGNGYILVKPKRVMTVEELKTLL